MITRMNLCNDTHEMLKPIIYKQDDGRKARVCDQLVVLPARLWQEDAHTERK